MNHETLERLLIDRHLGELSHDAESLLDEVMRLTPEARDLANSIETTLRTAALAMKPMAAIATPLPTLVTQTNSAESSRPILRTGLAGRFALAAAILLSFWLGSRVSAPLHPMSTTDDRPPIALGHDASPENLWSLRHHTSRTSPNRASVTQHIQWTSPIAKPLFGEKS